MILAAASKIIDQRGISALTVRGIAKDIGYSPASIYEYFTSKDAILQHMYFRGQGGIFDDVAVEIDKLSDDHNVFDVIFTMARVYRARAIISPGMYRLVMGNIVSPQLMGCSNAMPVLPVLPVGWISSLVTSLPGSRADCYATNLSDESPSRCGHSNTGLSVWRSMGT